MSGLPRIDLTTLFGNRDDPRRAGITHAAFKDEPPPMVISHPLKFVYLGIPRTANRATHLMLLELDGAEQVGLLHNMNVPAECRTYFTFCCVRNPYRRMLAYYLWRKMPHPWGSDAAEMTFAQYLAACEAGAMGPNSVAEFTTGIRLDAVYRYEELPDSLFALANQIRGLEHVAFPTIGQRLSRYWRHYYDQSLADQVWKLARDDFEQYGYDRESWR